MSPESVRVLTKALHIVNSADLGRMLLSLHRCPKQFENYLI